MTQKLIDAGAPVLPAGWRYQVYISPDLEYASVNVINETGVYIGNATKITLFSTIQEKHLVKLARKAYARTATGVVAKAIETKYNGRS